jgi:hypothetical protein
MYLHRLHLLHPRNDRMLIFSAMKCKQQVVLSTQNSQNVTMVQSLPPSYKVRTVDLLTPSPDISCREQFGQLLNQHQLLGHAAEIGTHLGYFAKTLLQTWKGQRLWCVDPWSENLPGYYETEPPERFPRPRQDDLNEARERLGPFASRVSLCVTRSCDLAEVMRDLMLDFVYVDADHRREQVYNDVRRWWPKIHSGGILAGHDILGYWEAEVRPAVEQFLAEEQLTAYTVAGSEELIWSFAPSWYVFKP